MVTEKEYLIICDESDRKGKFFSNFYGGVRVPMSEVSGINARLNTVKSSLGLIHEIKWSRTDPTVVERYEKLIKAFFDEVAAGRVIGRVMFTQNARVAQGLTPEHFKDEYYILYYQFIKHGFGLRYMPPHAAPPRLRIYLDEIGTTKEQMAKFRGFIAGLAQDSVIRKHGLILQEQDITEVRSQDHILLQCVDVVLGAMSFRLNDKHKEKVPGKRIRGNKTRAKERLYNFINQQICQVTGKKFNIGCSTSVQPALEGRWSAAYAHWLFQTTGNEMDRTKTKPK